jgi:hypothetical protein
VNPDVGCAISTNVILVGTELAPLGSDALEFLLGRRVRIADLHQHSLFSNRSTVVLLNDVLAFVPRLETVARVSVLCHVHGMSPHSPSETNTTAVAHTVTKNLAGDDMIASKDCVQLLACISRQKLKVSAEATHRFVQALRQVRQVQVGRQLVALGLEPRVEALLSRSQC